MVVPAVRTVTAFRAALHRLRLPYAVGISSHLTVFRTRPRLRAPTATPRGRPRTRVQMVTVRGLTAEDFVVKVDGQIQRVATLSEVTLPGVRNEAVGSAFAEAAHDIATNERNRRPRLFVIVMNDAAGDTDPFNRQAGTRIAHRVVDYLGPDDLAAVVFVRDNRHAQDLTADRTLLRRAIDRFNPMDTVGVSPLGVLARTHQFLRGMPGYRRAVIFISPVDRLASRGKDIHIRDIFGIDEEADAAHRDLLAISTAARVTHVPVYMFSTHGLHAPTPLDINLGQGRNADYEQHVERFRTVASLSGGRAVVADNAPAEQVPAVFEELGSYYALAYESSYPLDGRRRWLHVSVTHPGALVMSPRQLITAAKPAETERGSAVVSQTGNPG